MINIQSIPAPLSLVNNAPSMEVPRIGSGPIAAAFLIVAMVRKGLLFAHDSAHGFGSVSDYHATLIQNGAFVVEHDAPHQDHRFFASSSSWSHLRAWPRRSAASFSSRALRSRSVL